MLWHAGRWVHTSPIAKQGIYLLCLGLYLGKRKRCYMSAWTCIDMLPQVRPRFETLKPGKLTMAHLYLLLLLFGRTYPHRAMDAERAFVFHGRTLACQVGQWFVTTFPTARIWHHHWWPKPWKDEWGHQTGFAFKCASSFPDDCDAASWTCDESFDVSLGRIIYRINVWVAMWC